jgi:hypothetical protein
MSEKVTKRFDRDGRREQTVGAGETERVGSLMTLGFNTCFLQPVADDCA